MSKIYTCDEIEKAVMKAKIEAYEIENFKLQNMLKEYWKISDDERPEFSSILEEINHIFYKSLYKKETFIKKVQRKMTEIKGK